MRKLFSAILLSACIHAYGQSEKSITNSDIKNVKVFISGAQIERTFKTTLEAGVTRLAVENLSNLIDKGSVTANINGDAMVLSTSYELDYLKEKKSSPDLKRLRDSLEVLNANLGDLNMYEAVYNSEAAMLDANKSIGGSNVGLNADNLKKAIDFYRQRMIEIKTKLTDIAKKKVKLNEKIARINQQIQEENEKLNVPYGTILIDISAKQKTPVEIELSYYCQGAGWIPSYDIRAKNISSNINLMYKATVAQNTGENWDKVHVTLSTGNPTLGGNKPQLQPWFLKFYAPVYRQEELSKAPAPATRRGSRDDNSGYSIEGDMSDKIFAGNTVTAMQENQIVTEFEIQIPYSVLSDGKGVLMDIQSFDLPASFTYYSTPKIDKDAFLIGSITGWEKFNLIPGPSKIYLENSYVGESYINPSSVSDTLMLSFGRDKRIVIKREKVKDMNTSKFIGGNLEKQFLFETTIKNTKKDPVTVTIEDQFPLSTDESIKITTGEISNGNYEKETGMINWKFELKSGEIKKIRMGYTVKYPKDKIIQGL